MRGIVERIIAIKKDADSKTDDDAIAKTMERLEKEIQKLEELGCVPKDMNTGLIDFPAVRLDIRVWPCSKLDEDSVIFWHGLHEGFAGQKPPNEKEFYEDSIVF
jgi:hypothetical protein